MRLYIRRERKNQGNFINYGQSNVHNANNLYLTTYFITSDYYIVVSSIHSMHSFKDLPSLYLSSTNHTHRTEIIKLIQGFQNSQAIRTALLITLNRQRWLKGHFLVDEGVMSRAWLPSKARNRLSYIWWHRNRKWEHQWRRTIVTKQCWTTMETRENWAKLQIVEALSVIIPAQRASTISTPLILFTLSMKSHANCLQHTF